ncbi:MAG: hypothetical protein ACKV22_04180 [Bryobacteraceae bacterium]
MDTDSVGADFPKGVARIVAVGDVHGETQFTSLTAAASEIRDSTASTVLTRSTTRPATVCVFLPPVIE